MDLQKIIEWLNANQWIAIFVPFVSALIPGLKELVKAFFNAINYDIVPLKRIAEVRSERTLPDGSTVVEITKEGGLLDNLDLSKIMPFLLIGGVVFLMMSGGGGCKPKVISPQFVPIPVPVDPTVLPQDHPAPAADLQAIVAPVKSLASTKPAAAAALAPFYGAGADVIRRDASLVVTTSQAREAKIIADALFLQRTPMVGSLVGVGNLVDAALTQSVGLDDKPLDPPTRARLADTLDALCWALGG